MKQLFFLLILTIFNTNISAQALDDIVPRQILKDRKVLVYQPLREADIMWEKRIWRVIFIKPPMSATTGSRIMLPE